MTFTTQELRAWAAQIAQERFAEYAASWDYIEEALIIGHEHGLLVACDHSRHEGDRRRLDGLIKDAQKALKP